MTLRHSTIAAVELNDRVRDGNGCGLHAMITSQKPTIGCRTGAFALSRQRTPYTSQFHNIFAYE